jgi:hypothetical protein
MLLTKIPHLEIVGWTNQIFKFLLYFLQGEKIIKVTLWMKFPVVSVIFIKEAISRLLSMRYLLLTRNVG